MKHVHNSQEGLSRAEAQKAVEQLFELAVRLVDGMERGLAERGLTRARAELIWRLHHQGPMTQRALSQALQCTPRNVTGLVDALETAGFVARKPHPADRRATLVTLTEQGSTATAAMYGEYQKFATRLLADLATADLSCCVTVLDQLLERLRES